MAMPLTALGIIGLVVALVATEMLREAVRREYGSWAPVLARVLVRLAGLIHRSRAAEWRADVLYLQAEGRSGLWEASCHLLAAPSLLARELAGRRGSPAGGQHGDGAPVDWAAVSWVGLHDGFAGEVRATLQLGRGQSRAHLSAVYSVGNWFAPDPQDVSLQWSQDGEFRGLAVSGAETMAIVTTPAYYEQHLKKPPLGCDVYLASPEAFAVLSRLADSVDPDRVGGHRYGSLYFAFWDKWKVTSSCECCSGRRLR
jgi:hypothetical protein